MHETFWWVHSGEETQAEIEVVTWEGVNYHWGRKVALQGTQIRRRQLFSMEA